MATLTNPSEIARETLKQLMSQRKAPSPDNYRAIYNEIAGIAGKATEAFPERELKALVLALPRETPVQQRLSRQLDQSLKGANWEEYKKALVAFITEHSAESELNWGELIAEFLRQWEAKQSNLTPARKRESLEHVLASTSKNSEILFGRLQRLVKSWSLNKAEPDVVAELEDDVAAGTEPLSESPPAVPASAAPASRAAELLPELRSLFAYTLEFVVAPQLDDEPDLAAQAKTIAAAVNSATSLKAVNELMAEIKRFAYRLEFLAEDRNELRGGLLKLLQLMVDNVGELVVDDRWMQGQIAVVSGIVAQPMNTRTISDAERRLKEVIFKQSQLKHSLIEAKEALKQMLAGFVDHLAEFADSTSDYHDKIEVCVEKIGQAEDISQLQDVLAEVIGETRIIQINAQRSRDDLRVTKLRVEEAEKRINELEEELDKASMLVRNDQLTGTLNRRGLEEAFDSEVARSQRRKSPLCVAMLDIDNFKKLNDTLGHDAGDAALIHLVTIIRETLRPQDTLARFGGEEFIILLPDTPLEDAQKAIVRLQRELTKRYFLHGNEKVLITFSAGVTDYRRDDTQASVTKRADDAMYAAKKAGRNRVVTGNN
ncbi:GGDEF domain-containing protein [Propionivibrio sp.]|uniref:GGDEF domain-containing protein n=1 Tax=Propionivibrio sp. TaxID=2212460 RepID=UPI0025EF1C35|nr:GGDEF domain-containing protein [Propionivibrio sp.]MBK8746216.1 GGDEF domain-containing protein [Propionivibrio sp.]MBL0208374.1 GGDEF domain-containing protein [Propionivibrio sp.]